MVGVGGEESDRVCGFCQRSVKIFITGYGKCNVHNDFLNIEG